MLDFVKVNSDHLLAPSAKIRARLYQTGDTETYAKTVRGYTFKLQARAYGARHSVEIRIINLESRMIVESWRTDNERPIGFILHVHDRALMVAAPSDAGWQTFPVALDLASPGEIPCVEYPVLYTSDHVINRMHGAIVHSLQD